jgi:4-hydroxythreonine-4-phosphate dehydrogenase
MYHDQGLAPVKTVDFGKSVNITAGLPIVRTSVDHGTARDIAWTGTADADPMRAAIEMAARLR